MLMACVLTIPHSVLVKCGEKGHTSKGATWGKSDKNTGKTTSTSKKRFSFCFYETTLRKANGRAICSNCCYLAILSLCSRSLRRAHLLNVFSN